jgi:hypothetical protein
LVRVLVERLDRDGTLDMEALGAGRPIREHLEPVTRIAIDAAGDGELTGEMVLDPFA